ncbi:DEAD/DEAH box helicase [Desulfocicer niacini]
MKFEIKNNIKLIGLGFGAQNKIKVPLTMDNPKYADAQKAGRYTGAIDKKLRFYREIPGGLEVPRGFAATAYNICLDQDVDISIIDNRVEAPAAFQFHGTLRPFQQVAVDTMLETHHGVLESGTGSGKTVMALAIIAARGQRALIIIHTKELLHQWIDRIESFLGIPSGEVGQIGGGKFTLGDRITVGMVQTLCRRPDEIKGQFGQVVCDEVHRAPSKTFTDVVSATDAKYLLGLTATAYRRDGLGRVIFLYLGDRRHQVDKAELLNLGHLCNARVIWHQTDFDTCLNPSEEYSKVLSELTQNTARNRQICSDVAGETCQGIKLVLSDRKAHCHQLANILEEAHGIEAHVLTGGMSRKDREKVTRDIQNDGVKTLICTGQLIGEGYDLPALESLFLGTPIKFSGRLIQYIGRVLRPAPGKSEVVIHDYYDHLVGVLEHGAGVRAGVYEKEGIRTA